MIYDVILVEHELFLVGSNHAEHELFLIGSNQEERS
jgi:hypothetical protein